MMNRAHIVQASFYFGWIHFRVHFDSKPFPCVNTSIQFKSPESGIDVILIMPEYDVNLK